MKLERKNGTKSKPTKQKSIQKREVSDVELKFGLRFFGWFGRNLNIPRYSRMTPEQLQVKIGIELLKNSGIVPVDVIELLKKLNL